MNMNGDRARSSLLPISCSLAMFASGFAATAQVVHYGCEADQKLEQTVPTNLDHMGHSTAIGDFNDDGIADIVMGGYDRLDGGQTTEPKTRVFIFLGTGNSPSSGLPLFNHRVTIASSATSSATFDLFGFAVAPIGDLNGDGCDELAIGAPLFGSADTGRVSIFGGLAGLSPTGNGVIELEDSLDELFSFNGIVDGGWFGASLATAKNASGVYQLDLLVGAPGNGPVDSSSVTGTVYLYESPTMGDAGTLAVGLPGITIGAAATAATPGISGSLTTGFVAHAHRLLHGEHGGDCFGQSVAFIGNVDGQPGQEFLVGAPQWAAESGSSATRGPGYVQLFRMGSITPLIEIEGDQEPMTTPRQEGEAFGFSVAGGVDLDQPVPDSVPDLVIGAPLFNVDASGPGTGQIQAGRVRVFSGAFAALGSEVPLLVPASGPNGTFMVGVSGSEWFGYSVAVLSDINNDLAPDILVGAQQAAIGSPSVCIAPQQPPLRTGAGGYAALFTSGGTPPGAKLVIFYGEAFKDHMGRAVAAGDLFGTSGLPEIILSGPAWTPFLQTDPTEIGRGYVWNGDTVLQ